VKIVVLIKEVPDTYGTRKLSLETGLADRAATDAVIDEIGERALELALSYADDHDGTEVVVLSMAPASAEASVRKGLAMGAHDAVHVVDDALLGADLGLTAEVLAAAIRRTGFDLVIAGNVSTDGAGGMLPAMLAELLEVPHATGLTSAVIGDAEITGDRASDSGTMRVRAALPAVISVTERMPEARFPNFKSVMAAKKKAIETLSLADLGVNAEDPAASRSIMLAVSERPARQGGTKIVDEGDGGTRIAEYLVQNRLV
jgi:electron transfer flavoprotein beta subunit